MQESAPSGTPVVLLDGVTTGTSSVIAIPRTFKSQTIFIVGAEHTSAGKVKVEAAHVADFAGTWTLIGSEITVGDNTVQAVVPSQWYPFLRVRVSTTVENGTVTAIYIGA
jgi:preprotein translocase subunit SecB